MKFAIFHFANTVIVITINKSSLPLFNISYIRLLSSFQMPFGIKNIYIYTIIGSFEIHENAVRVTRFFRKSIILTTLMPAPARNSLFQGIFSFFTFYSNVICRRVRGDSIFTIYTGSGDMVLID